MAERGENQEQTERERGRSLRLPLIQYWVCYSECVHCSEVLFTMSGSLFGRLSLEEGDSANSLEGLEIKLGGEGKNRSVCAGCVSVWKTDEFSRYVFCCRLGQVY